MYNLGFLEAYNVPDSLGFRINICNKNTADLPADRCSGLKLLKNGDDIKCLKSWSVTKKNILGCSNLLKISGK